MMNYRKSVLAVLAASALVFSLSACQKHEGPAEKAGQEVDKTVEKAGQQVEKAGDKIKELAKDAKK